MHKVRIPKIMVTVMTRPAGKYSPKIPPTLMLMGFMTLFVRLYKENTTPRKFLSVFSCRQALMILWMIASMHPMTAKMRMSRSRFVCSGNRATSKKYPMALKIIQFFVSILIRGFDVNTAPPMVPKERAPIQ